MEYQEMISKILEVTPIKEDEIFNFELSPHKDEFNKAFEFYDKAISNHKHFGVEPHLLFYYDDYSVNAAATKNNEYFIIYINAGTIVHLIQQYKTAQIPLLQQYQDFEESIDTSIADLMYNIALHFTFYHELGHLVQKSDLLEKTLHERPTDVADFLLERHILELDADTFGSLCVGTHLLQYAKQMFGDDINTENITKLIVIACSTALLYLLSFQTNDLPLYFEEHTHPHPVIRITCVVFHIAGYCSQALENYQLELNNQEIIKEALSFAHSISSNGSEKSIISNYQRIIGEQANEIEDYIRKTRDIQETDPSLSANKWNQYVRERNA